MEIISHNSLTYHKPQWWIRPFNFIAKCQSLTIEEQYNLGVKIFDFRFKYFKNDGFEVVHGLAKYKTLNLLSILSFINDKKDCKVLLQFEEDFHDPIDNNKYVEFIDRLIMNFPDIDFYYSRIIDTRTRSIKNISGMVPKDLGNIVPAYWWVGKTPFSFPKLFAKKNNKETKEKYADYKSRIWIDYVQY